jgi:thioredoxin-like negative regulator of GroEL
MPETEFLDKYPDLKPITAPPSLYTVNGLGCTVYGGRDFDEETSTYVKTHCLSFLHVPLVNLAAYRVADAPNGGWYFLGRVPLTTAARLWNVFLLFAVLATAGAVAWNIHTRSPNYLAARKMDEADQLAADGRLAPAARLYREVAEGENKYRADAIAGIKKLLDERVSQAAPADAAGAFAVAVDLRRWSGIPDDLFDRAKKLADRHAKSDPRGALALIDAVAPTALDARALTDLRRGLLERIVARDPADPEPASLLAEIYEADRKPDRCEALLTPHVKRLGTTEGARILGQIFARKGKFDEAHALLVPYAEGRLRQFHEAESRLRQGRERLYNDLSDQIQSGQAPPSFLERYRKADQAERVVLIEKYLDQQVAADSELRAVQETVLQNRRVVPVALDLGMVFLSRAQAIADPAARRRELEKAEKTFLAVQGAAGADDFYRLHLGQVYYWLGKHADGRKLFDELLAARQRQPDVLLLVARALREVGAVAEARSLLEEGYAAATRAEDKQHIAVHRALLSQDLDDKIGWLDRGDKSTPGVQAEFHAARGDQALRQGRDIEAAEHLRQALTCYGRMPESAATLNNSALVYHSLYFATGDAGALAKRAVLLEKSLGLQPGNSILLSNTAACLEELALRDVIGPAIDFRSLRLQGSQSLLYYLYPDEAAEQRLAKTLQQHAGLARARSHYQRLVLLAPRNPYAYGPLANLAHFTRDQEALAQLWDRLRKVELDHSDTTREYQDYLSGKKDDHYRQSLAASLKHARANLQEARKQGGVTHAVAATTLARYLTSQDALGIAVDPDEIVRLAEEAHTAAPSKATESALTDALLVRAGHTLSRQEPAYAALAARCRRSLGHPFLIAILLADEGPLYPAVRDNADVRRALKLLRQRLERFPADADEWAWAILRRTHPNSAAFAAQVIKTSELNRLKLAIDLKLSPMSAAEAYRSCWALQIAGEPAKGAEILKRCAARGVPMPASDK